MAKRLKHVKAVVGDGKIASKNEFKEMHKVDRSKFDISKFYRVSVGHLGNSKAYRDNWDAIFAPKKKSRAKP